MFCESWAFTQFLWLTASHKSAAPPDAPSSGLKQGESHGQMIPTQLLKLLPLFRKEQLNYNSPSYHSKPVWLSFFILWEIKEDILKNVTDNNNSKKVDNSFLFHRRKKCKQVWNDLKVITWWQFSFLCELSFCLIIWSYDIPKHQSYKMHKRLSNVPCYFLLTSILSSHVAPVQLCACGRLWAKVNSRSTGWTTVMWLTSWNRATDCPNLSSALLPCTLSWPAAGAMTPAKDPPSPN